MTVTIGSLCSGYGGLEEGLRAVVPGRVAWHSEVDPDANRVLAHHWPGVPNHGDLTSADWAGAEPVDWLTAGFPCQPVSAAGQRKGIGDSRWLWDGIAAALGRMEPRPRMLLLENAPGLLTANRGRAMGRVVHDLAARGYVGRYRVLRASDAGAPHNRPRVFLVASHKDAPTWPLLGVGRAGPVADAPGAERGAAELLPVAPTVGRAAELGERAGSAAWGGYAPAIRGWERVTGRPAPAPAVPGRRGQRRLNPAFVEWMMGLPAGWVTDVPGVSRRAQLRLLGNGVVPQQAALAVRQLLRVSAAGVAA